MIHYVPLVTMSINDNMKSAENLNSGLEKTVSWNKYRFKITTKPKVNNLDYMIASTFRNVNRLFVQSFKVG